VNTFEDNKEQDQSGTFSEVAGNEIKNQSINAIKNKLSQGTRNNADGKGEKAPSAASSLNNNPTQPSSDAIKNTAEKIAGDVAEKGIQTAKSATSTAVAAVPGAGTAATAISKVANAIKGLSRSAESASQRASLEDDFKGVKGIILVFLICVSFLCVLISNLIPSGITDGWTETKRRWNQVKKACGTLADIWNDAWGEEPIYVSDTIEEVEEVFKRYIETDYYTSIYAENLQAQALVFMRDIIDGAFTGVTKEYLTDIRKDISSSITIDLKYSGLPFSYSKNYNKILSEEKFLEQPYPYCLKLNNGSYYTIEDFLEGKIPPSYLNNDLNIVEVISIVGLSKTFEVQLPEDNHQTFNYQSFAEALCRRKNWQYFFEIEATLVWDNDIITVQTDDGEIIEISHRAEADKYELQLYEAFDNLLEANKKLNKPEKLSTEEISALNAQVASLKTEIEELHKTMFGGMEFGEERIETHSCLICDENGEIAETCPVCLGEQISDTCASCGSTRFGVIPAVICGDCLGKGSVTGNTDVCKACFGEAVFVKCNKCGNEMTSEEYVNNNNFCNNPSCNSDDTYDYKCPVCKGNGFTIAEDDTCGTCLGTGIASQAYYGCLDCNGTEYEACQECGGLGKIKKECDECGGDHVIEEVIPAAQATQFSINRDFHYEFVIKPYGLAELYSFVGISPYDYSFRFPTMTNAELLDEMEATTRSLIDSLGLVFGPSSLKPRSTRSLIYNDLLKYNNGFATGRSAMYYISNPDTSFIKDYNKDIVYRYNGISYSVGKNAFVLDMFAPMYQTSNTSNIACTFGMLAAYFDNREISAKSIENNCVTKDGLFSISKFEEIYEMSCITSNIHPSIGNIISNVKAYTAPVLLFVSATKEPWTYNGTTYADHGHYILVIGYDDEKIFVYDSASRTNTMDGIPRGAFNSLPIGSNCSVYTKDGGYIGKTRKTW